MFVIMYPLTPDRNGTYPIAGHYKELKKKDYCGNWCWNLNQILSNTDIAYSFNDIRIIFSVIIQNRKDIVTKIHDTYLLVIHSVYTIFIFSVI